MHASLVPHPDTPAGSVRSIEVDVSRLEPAELSLRYRLLGALAGVRVPPLAVPARTDGLWRHSCFEVFLGRPEGSGYCEFNLSPSSQWAAYRFSGYRAGMSPLDTPAPAIRVEADDDQLTLRALLDLKGLDAPEEAAGWQLGLAAVIEDMDGRLSYWALTHSADKPDFHRRDCFALQLPPAEQR